MAGELELCHAYRRLYRAGLRAVQFSKPARYVVRDRLRSGFRSPGGTFDEQRVRRTIWFLNAATDERGLEHKILKNILWVQWIRRRVVEKPRSFNPIVAMAKERSGNGMHEMDEKDSSLVARSQKQDARDILKKNVYVGYDRTVAMLNDTMGLCL